MCDYTAAERQIKQENMWYLSSLIKKNSLLCNELWGIIAKSGLAIVLPTFSAIVTSQWTCNEILRYIVQCI